MGRITLPSKISNWTIIKLFMLSVLIFTGYYFYPNLISNQNTNQEDDWSQVLAATTETEDVYKVTNYLMKDVIRPECDDSQPFMDFFCTKTTYSIKTVDQQITNIVTVNRLPTFGVSSVSDFSSNTSFNNTYTTSYAVSTTVTSTVAVPNVQINSSGIEYYGNPVLENISGVPLLVYYGGFYEILLNTNPQSVVNITRSFKTFGNVGYTAGCKSSWFPSSIAKKNNTVIFGGGGLEDLLENRCYERKDPQGGWGTTYRGNVECLRRAQTLGVPLESNCRLSATESCWDRRYQCVTLNKEGYSQYYNYPNITRMSFNVAPSSFSGPRLSLNPNIFVNQGPSSGGSATRDAKSYCIGKSKNNCAAPFSELEYGINMVLRVSSSGDNRHEWSNASAIKFPNYGIFKDNKGDYKDFYNRVYYGFNPTLQNQSSLNWVFGGYDSPLAAYNLKNRVDLVRIYFPGSSDWYYKYRIENYKFEPVPSLLTFEVVPKLGVGSGVLADYVSDKYYFTLQYANSNLVFKRFEFSGYMGNQPTQTKFIALRNVSLSYLKNVSFSVNSGNDVDILIAPNFVDSKNNLSAKSRMFRAEKFNSPTGTHRLFELNETNGGYKFPSLGPGNNAPLTFRYYNNDDANTDNDYAIFVSRNYVLTSKVPPTTPECVPNYNLVAGGLTLINTDPNSINKGIVPSAIDTTTSTYNLNYTFNSAINLSCPSGIVNVPAGTKMYLTLYDGITSAPLPTTLAANLLSDRKSFNFLNVKSPNFEKYFYKISFNYNGTVYNYPSLGIDPNRYYTLQSFINIFTYLDNQDQDPFADAKMVVTKTFKNVTPQQRNLTAPDGESSFTLHKDTFSNFFWDHDLSKSGNTLIDNVKYKICFTNTADTKVSRIGFTNSTTTSTSSISNNYFTGTINNGCLDLFYKSNVVNSYNLVPQSLDIYLTSGNVQPPTSYLNFRVNGNTMIKRSSDVKFYTTSDVDKRYEGVYVSGSAQGGKNFRLSNTLMGPSYFNIPYFDKLTKAFNFSYTENLVDYALPETQVTSLLLTDTKPSGSVNNFNKIDAFNSVPVSATPTIIYVAKNKQLYFDLTDLNIYNNLENVYFVSTDKSNIKERIVFHVDCSDLENYSLICGNRAVYHLKGGIYGDFKLIGNLSTQNEDRSFINISQNPDVLIYLQQDLRSYKMFNVTRSKTIFKYFND